tara:strand:- start:265 stop:672 length:408 start_codon:yes stop_codon:yes gene_type:complete
MSTLKANAVQSLSGSGTNVTIGNTSTHVSDAGNVTQNTVQGLLKAWTVDADSTAGTVGDSFNNSSFSDDGTGQTTITLTNPMNTATDWCVTQGNITAYPYKSAAETSTTHSLDVVNGAGNFTNGGSNGQVSGDLA